MNLPELDDKQRHCIDVCGSACCKNLGLRYSPGQLEREYRAWREQVTRKKAYLPEVWLIFPMLEHVRSYRSGGFRHFYRCKMLVDGKCSIYANRPAMCSQCGTGYPSTFPGCVYAESEAEA